MFADLSLADDMTYRPLIGQTTSWHLGCWHEVCEVWITQIYRRKHDTWDLEIRGQRGDKNTPFLNPRPRCLYHVNLKYSQVCEGSDCWLEHSWDNWFTLFAWLGLVSVLIKITIRNSVLIISHCENIITGTLIWIITGLDSLEARTLRLLWECQCQSVVDEAFSGAGCWPHVSDRDEITPPSVSSHSMAEWGGGQENRNYHTNETWNAKLWPALGPNI